MIKRVRYINLIDELCITKEDVVISGSGLMALLGLRNNRDLDVIARTREFERLQNSNRFKSDIDIHGNPVLIYDNIEIYLKVRGDIGFSKDDIFKHAQEVQGIKFLSPGIFLRWKLKAGREKDLNDIRLVWNNYGLMR